MEQIGLSQHLAALDASDVPVAQAFSFREADWPALLALRSSGTATDARTLVDEARRLGSSLATDALAAPALLAVGAEEEALQARLESLAFAPRWEPWEVAQLLTHIAEACLKLGDPASAEQAARRALAFDPVQPYALHALGAARRDQDDELGRAAIVAYLRLAGYGGSLVDDEPSAGERAAVPFVPDLAALEALSDEDAARFLAFGDFEQLGSDAFLRPRRHALNCLRRHSAAAARLALVLTRNWQHYRTEELAQLDLAGDGAVEAAWNAELLDRVISTPDGAAAAKAARKRTDNADQADLRSRRRCVKHAAAAGEVAALERLLLDWDRFVRFDAAEALLRRHESTLARRFVELSVELEDLLGWAGTFQAEGWSIPRGLVTG